MSERPGGAPVRNRQLLQTVYREALAPVTDAMFALANVGAGNRVLDIGAGAGDTTLQAARHAGPTGRVVATDASLTALQGLIDRLAALPDRHNIAVEGIAAERLALERASFDVALARNCVMYFEDLGRAFRNVRTALRPGGRLVASVYGPLENEPFHAIPLSVVTRRRQLRAPYPEYFQAFQVRAQDVEAALLAAGFCVVEQRSVSVGRSFPSVDAALEALRDSGSLRELLALLPDAQLDGAWADIAAGFRAYETAAGMHLPGEQVVILGVA